jgi:hypothetical protein
MRERLTGAFVLLTVTLLIAATRSSMTTSWRRAV